MGWLLVWFWCVFVLLVLDLVCGTVSGESILMWLVVSFLFWTIIFGVTQTVLWFM